VRLLGPHVDIPQSQWCNARPTAIFQGSHSNLRIKLQDYFRTFQDLRYQYYQHLFLYHFGPWPMNLTAKQDIVKIKVQWNWKFNSTICFIRVKLQQRNWCAGLIDFSAPLWSNISTSSGLFQDQCQFQDFPGHDFSFFIFQDFSWPVGTLTFEATKHCRCPISYSTEVEGGNWPKWLVIHQDDIPQYTHNRSTISVLSGLNIVRKVPICIPLYHKQLTSKALGYGRC